MEIKTTSPLNFLKKNRWFFIGIILVTLYVFSNFFYGYKLSFTNVNYDMQPYDVYDVETDGPWLSDIADSEYPLIYKIFYSRTGFSLWDSDIALGSESNTIAELINPMKWVYILPLEVAAFLKAFSEFLIAFFSMFLFLKAIGLKKYPAAIGGILYTFSSVIVAWLGWAHSDVAAWAPLLFFAIEKLLSTIKIKYMFLTAFVIYMMLIVGMPTYAAYFLYAAGVYIVVFTFIKHWNTKRNIFIVGVLFSISVILAAVLSLPYTYTLLTSVVGNGYADSRSSYAESCLTLDYLRTFILPNIRDGLSLHANESTLYVGIISVVLFPFALCNLKSKKRNIFFLCLSAIVFLLIFSNSLNFIYTKLPLINTSLKYRVITLLTFSMAVLAGITINDILENKEYYKKKIWLPFGLIIWTGAVLYIATKDVFAGYYKNIAGLLLIVTGIVLCLIIFLYKNYKPVYFIMAILVVLDSSQFVKEYLPWIDSQAEMIPDASPSVEYMMANTQNEERVVGIGDWTLFPNTPSYYGLNDIRVHGFVSTNTDLVEYYTNIDENAYLTRTRTRINNIKNYELLKYMGVRYIYGPNLGNSIALDDSQKPQKPLGVISSHSNISQDVYLEKGLNMIQLLMATYGTDPQSNGNMTFSLISRESGLPVFDTIIPVAQIRDNSFLNISIDPDALQKEGIYTILLSFDNIGEDTITFWIKDSANSNLIYADNTLPSSLVMNASYINDNYKIVCAESDSILVAELNEYADKAELCESVSVLPSEEDILSAMMQDYSDNTVFITDENEATEYNIPLTEHEYIDIEEYDDDYIKIKCTSEYERYVMLNDYYNKDWTAYVNGKETDIKKVNYLMRGIIISPAEDMIIEFKYEPDNLYLVTICSTLTAVLTLFLFLFNNKLQNKLNKLVKNK